GAFGAAHPGVRRGPVAVLRRRPRRPRAGMGHGGRRADDPQRHRLRGDRQDDLHHELRVVGHGADGRRAGRTARRTGAGRAGVGDVVMRIGRYWRLILDSWSRPKYAKVIGRKKLVPDATIVRRFRRYERYAGLAFWLFITRDWVPDELAPPAPGPDASSDLGWRGRDA